jgi:hypothetical protein
MIASRAIARASKQGIKTSGIPEAPAAPPTTPSRKKTPRCASRSWNTPSLEPPSHALPGASRGEMDKLGRAVKNLLGSLKRSVQPKELVGADELGNKYYRWARPLQVAAVLQVAASPSAPAP